MRILFVGDIVGAPGVEAVTALVPMLREEYAADLVFANGENAAGGSGLTGTIAKRIYAAGVDGLTLGNHCWSRRELLGWIVDDERMVRPANGMPAWPGRGYAFFEARGQRLCLTNLLGQVWLSPAQSPFLCLPELLEQIDADEGGAPQHILIDFHAEATAEKASFAYFVDGRVSAVIGTHTHVQTADARVLPGGTAFISDVGMCGPRDGVIGMDVAASLTRMADGLPSRYKLASGPSRLDAVLIELHEGRPGARSIERLQVLHED